MRLQQTWFRELIAAHEAPCVSIYMPMVRANPPAAENARLFRDLVEKARDELLRGYPQKDVRALVEKIESIAAEGNFWTGPRDGLAVFASPDLLRVIDLHERIDSSVSVADTFHVKPLIRMLQTDARFHVLALTVKAAVVYEGDQHRLRRLEPRNVPQNPDIVSKMRLTHQSNMATDMSVPDTQYPGEGTIPGGASSDHFFRAVDKGVWEEFSRDSKLPLILVADEKTNTAFRSVSKNTHLLADRLTLDPAGVDDVRMHREAWKVIEPRLREDVQKLTDQFMAAQARQRGSAELQTVVEAAAVGRVDTLFVDATRHIPGRLDATSGSMQFRPADLQDPRADDVLDDLAEMVLRTDGAVLVLPPEQMPTDTGVAAIYRY